MYQTSILSKKIYHDVLIGEIFYLELVLFILFFGHNSSIDNILLFDFRLIKIMPQSMTDKILSHKSVEAISCISPWRLSHM